MVILIRNYVLIIVYYVFNQVMASLNHQQTASDRSQFVFDMSQTISGHGYPFERHEITTEDGYLLDLHRIPHGKHQRERNTKPVLLMHGLMGSAENWIIAGQDKALAYLLADSGYDVWLGNARGNFHSRKHITLNPDRDQKFWQFSWHEIGVYDLPAKIDHILRKTRRKKLHYVGHSQGTTSFFVMTSERPEYNERVHVMIALAPVAFMKNLRQPILKVLSPYYNLLADLANYLHLSELIPVPNGVLRLFGKLVCERSVITSEICANILFLAGGYDSKQLNRSLIPLIMSTTPAGCSTRQALHYAQGIVSGYFRQYDYGFVKNLQIYKTKSPPAYNLSNVQVPIGLFHGYNDLLAATADVQKLSGALPHVVTKYLVPFKDFNHLDFLWAKDVVGLLYKNVLKIMDKYCSRC